MRLASIIIIILINPLLFTPFFSYSQQQKNTQPKQLDIFDILRSKKVESLKLSDSINLKVKPYKLYISAFPVIGYNPALGAVLGATFNPAVFLGDPKNTPISAFAVNFQVTSKSQLMISLRSSIFTSKARMIFKGDLRFYMYYQPTYGLGSNISGADTTSWVMPNGDHAYSASEAAEPMRFQMLRVYESAYRKVKGHFYVGVGYFLDYHWDINDAKLSLDSGHIFLTQHYIYSVENGFNPESYMTSGMAVSFLYDSRDNSCRPTKGIYASIIPRYNPTWLGSSKTSLMIETEFRTYVRLSHRNPAHLLAFWYCGGFVAAGKLPYLDLPAIGWDTYGRTGRGYVQGRIRGIDYLYGEVEYRFPISPNTRILSGVVFCNATTCSDRANSIKIMEYVAPGFGAGLRVMLNKKSNSNVTIDMGFGLNGSKGLFLNINEAF
ncbi:MAG: BamA/TamA family outer membrane protein [Bacteroidota bacterium]